MTVELMLNIAAYRFWPIDQPETVRQHLHQVGHSLGVFGTILILYFAVSYPLSRFGHYLEKRLAPSRH